MGNVVPTANAVPPDSSESSTGAVPLKKNIEVEDEGEEECVEEVELLQVDVGDVIKLKQVLDEAVSGTFLNNINLKEDQRLDNIKLFLMLLACAFAAGAQFSPIPFPDSRPLLGICCCFYFALSGILQLITTFFDKDSILVTIREENDSKFSKNNKKMSGYGLRIRTSLTKYDEWYSVVIEFQDMEDTPFVKKTWSVGNFFDVDGMFDEVGLNMEVEKLFMRFEKGDYEKPDDIKKKKTE